VSPSSLSGVHETGATPHRQGRPIGTYGARELPECPRSATHGWKRSGPLNPTGADVSRSLSLLPAGSQTRPPPPTPHSRSSAPTDAVLAAFRTRRCGRLERRPRAPPVQFADRPLQFEVDDAGQLVVYGPRSDFAELLFAKKCEVPRRCFFVVRATGQIEVVDGSRFTATHEAEP
jgi:hypothetical protein